MRSPHAEAVTLVLDQGTSEREVPLARRTGDGAWTVTLDDAPPGTRYGLRADGAWAPERGLAFDRAKLLIDPWALAVDREPHPSESLLATARGVDSGAAMPRAVVVDRHALRGSAPPVERPRVPWRDTVIYEAHVRQLTRRHPDLEPALRGTYLGLASEPVIEHLRSLGVTTVELMPIFQFASEPHLWRRGGRNAWGYAPFGWLAPHAAYATGGDGRQSAETAEMVRRLHAAGLEVILDVVFNHSAEGGLDGQTLGLRGLGWGDVYRLHADGRAVDWTGTGNTLDASRPLVHRLVIDSLRWWATAYGVDGFRFDLAPTLGRGADGRFDPRGELLAAIAADPWLRDLKLIAEPWDLGPDGYAAGRFAAPFREWNDAFRDTARRFWTLDARTDALGTVCAELATRLAGSQDRFGERGPTASIHYVISHDGPTLVDWTRYARKHNEANGEDNRDGPARSFARNWGVEGPTDDPEIRAARWRARRNALATLVFARGVPMLAQGDELGRTQLGNDNAYCHDNERTWIDWANTDREWLAEVRALLALRRRFDLLRGEGFLRSADETGTDAVAWLAPDGAPLAGEAWHRLKHAAFAMLLEEGTPAAACPSGLALLINGSHDEVAFSLPTERRDGPWWLLFATPWPDLVEAGSDHLDGWRCAPRSLVLLAFGDAARGAARSAPPPKPTPDG